VWPDITAMTRVSTAETSVASDLQDELFEIDGNYEVYDVLKPTLFHLFIVLESL